MDTILRVATFNLKSSLLGIGIHNWKYRRELLFRAFRELDADITGVQELTPRMRSDFEQELHDYNLIGRGRGGLILNEHSDIAVKNRLKIKFGNTFWLSNQPSRESRMFSLMSPLAWIFPRICTVAEIIMGQKRVRVFNTHLDVTSEAARYLQLKMICKHISLCQEKDPLPTLLMGDFNALPYSRSIYALENNAFGYKNVHLSGITNQLEGGTYHSFKGGLGLRRLDYIFASDDFELIKSEIVRSSYDGIYPSDHYPIVASLLLK
ncbi:MAG: endonuclease/exonuclease/phosphatase family protein [Clostridiales bacterium]|nr:endonuclease/exonuclease/phosphatase family protein [Clostridiales bacterium]